jgi:hypothetical protein
LDYFYLSKHSRRKVHHGGAEELADYSKTNAAL